MSDANREFEDEAEREWFFRLNELEEKIKELRRENNNPFKPSRNWTNGVRIFLNGSSGREGISLYVCDLFPNLSCGLSVPLHGLSKAMQECESIKEAGEFVYFFESCLKAAQKNLVEVQNWSDDIVAKGGVALT